jgi:hypothetical protein
MQEHAKVLEKFLEQKDRRRDESWQVKLQKE